MCKTSCFNSFTCYKIFKYLRTFLSVHYWSTEATLIQNSSRVTVGDWVVRAGAGEWRCMFSGTEFDCMGESTVPADGC